MKIIKITDKSVESIPYPKELTKTASDRIVSQYLDYVRSRTNVKAGSTKTVSNVRGGGAKPWRQKGTGRARQGSIRSPQWRGGGIIFGPLSGAHRELKMNKKMRRLAFLACLTSLAKDGGISIIDTDKLTPKDIRKQLLTIKGDKKTIILVGLDRDNTSLSRSSNLKNTEKSTLNRFGATQMLGSKMVVFDVSAWDELVKRYQS